MTSYIYTWYQCFLVAYEVTYPTIIAILDLIKNSIKEGIIRRYFAHVSTDPRLHYSHNDSVSSFCFQKKHCMIIK